MRGFWMEVESIGDKRFIRHDPTPEELAQFRREQLEKYGLLEWVDDHSVYVARAYVGK